MNHHSTPGMGFWRATIIGLILAAVAYAGAGFTGDYSTAWYQELARPTVLTPTLERAIPVIWAVLYFLTGLAIAAVLRAGCRWEIKAVILALFGVQLALNYSYSVVFTMQQNLSGALQIASGLTAVTAVLIVVCATMRIWQAVICLLPYLAWSGFASYLTAELWQLNR